MILVVGVIVDSRLRITLRLEKLHNDIGGLLQVPLSVYRRSVRTRETLRQHGCVRFMVSPG